MLYLFLGYEPHPDEEVLWIIVPDAPGIRPVPGHTRCQQEWGNGLVKEKVIINQLLLLLLCHLAKGIVLAWEKRRALLNVTCVLVITNRALTSVSPFLMSFKKIILTVYTCANDHLLVQDTHNIHDDPHNCTNCDCIAYFVLSVASSQPFYPGSPHVMTNAAIVWGISCTVSA